MWYFKDQSKLLSLNEMEIINNEGDDIQNKSEDPTEMK